jgi:hypothetical protein
MDGTRVSVGGLLAVILFAAIGLAALRASTDLWAGLVNASALMLLGSAILAAILRRGASRAFWLGFAVFGCGYLALASGPQTVRRLPTSAPLEWLRSVMSLAPWTIGDRLVVMRQGSLTAATIVEIKDATYKVKFDGWTSYHDEWINPGRIAFDFPVAPVGASTNPLPVSAYLPFSAAENFLLIGHALLALLIGTVGGLVARFFIAGRDGRVRPSIGRRWATNDRSASREPSL